ncbi:metallo-beta-lactamase superfamily protein [Niveomyces insectorum RCEF 264]|uniref:Metallo-beta-lactamase superfamily protein n=1 Tax=Niveomyces insectorum RCEF 264 TaxID=1081102 RepID=A0A167MVB9_9HYPO|nr:metallo-beta-lactamase superfamily protein [Niveomyces insectorum RCEF 264]
MYCNDSNSSSSSSSSNKINKIDNIHSHKHTRGADGGPTGTPARGRAPQPGRRAHPRRQPGQVHAAGHQHLPRGHGRRAPARRHRRGPAGVGGGAWHPDHVGGIDQVRQLVPGVPVYQNQAGAGAGGRATTTASTDDVLDIADGQAFRVPGATLRAVHTPGHAANHMVFVLAEEGAVFAGDNVLGQGTAVFEDLAVYLRSLARMRALYPVDDGATEEDSRFRGRRLYPGHGPVVADGPAKITEYMEHRQQREDQVVQLLRTQNATAAAAAVELASVSPPSAWTAQALVEVIYADVRKDLHAAAERGVVQILQKLESEGKAVRDGSAWRLRALSPL